MPGEKEYQMHRPYTSPAFIAGKNHASYSVGEYTEYHQPTMNFPTNLKQIHRGINSRIR